MKDKSYQDITNITIPTDLKIPKLRIPATEYSMNASTTGNIPQNISQNSGNVNSISSQNLVTSKGGLLSLGNQVSNPVNEVPNSKFPVTNPGNKGPQTSKILNTQNSKPEYQISGLISKGDNAKKDDYTDIKYGKDASVVITETSTKSKNSVGRYSSTIDVTPSASEFGTVIGGVRVNGQSKFDVIKPTNNQSEDSNLRSKLGVRKLKKEGYKNNKNLSTN